MDKNEGWNKILYEILQCSICLEIPGGKILQCTNGHHICHFCFKKVPKCPICNEDFITTRNLVAEQLIDNLEHIKESVENQLKQVEKKCLQRIVEYEKKMFQKEFESISTQTDGVTKFNTQKNGKTHHNCRQNNKSKNTIHATASSYPCCIRSCMYKLPCAILIKHLRKCHKNIFYEVYQDNKRFSKSCIIEIDTLPKEHNFAFNISNMALFFFKIMIHNDEELQANIQLVDDHVSPEQFQCELMLKNQNLHLQRYMTVVLCHYEKPYPLCLTGSEVSCLMKCKSFECTLIIERRNLW
ncbi:uncharacterized protein LOC100650839 isoform X1 [Bombus terrestris]|uniref:Uncharacterized protein LOC100650839 isoform X1 n=1 Tax=Bombus terrestris TaxID=30195 RepID=A0A9B7CZV5_BOMTE|nr:uncharacterized protein LOC100650839 isoform X1 [Bombus terrestris]